MARIRWHYAPCTLGLEDLLAREVTDLGGTSVRAERGGVAFQGPARVGYAVALWSRVATRVFEELQRGRIGSADDVYTVARRVRWERFLRPGQTLAVHGIVRSYLVKHSHYAALRVKDAVVDHLREVTGERPDVDTEFPDVPLRVVVQGKVATISRDLVGQSLHKRGYRPDVQHKSPLNEALAAGLLLHTGWDRRSPLCDPMCGSGTLLVEAAWLAGDRAPGLVRAYPFEVWPDTDRAAWEQLRAEAERRWEAGRANIPQLLGNDRHPGAVALARRAIGLAGVAERVELTKGPVDAYTPSVHPTVVVTNPPYGERLDEPDLVASWRDLGGFLRRQPGTTAWVLSGNAEVTRHLRLKASRKVPVMNGKIACRWLSYPVHDVL